ncbi:uncharacterized protein LAESUDRAFT_409078 [Laetiporus sulphureus 93-53]|uniref:Uncharacterized protein n=1 Tax=Laetiporus sulphureus 93-53 TaxID=1314785 RepID=A0A165CA63_9APHY|nr:uncharacterized protein LAESUDRAFT_409078 [Laetiporus sulphureus 93-53]KZT02455.1 hypothetical protein LAESUDRAFT_409078 [Laetiporus sulphureus 93-53]
MSTPAASTTVAAAAPNQSDARFETTAAWAQVEAPTAELSNEVGKNASQMQNVAEQVAVEAQEKKPQVVSAVNQLEAGLALENKTNQASEQGQRDIDSARATVASAAQSAVEQAKTFANSAYETAQSLYGGLQTSSTDAMTNSNFSNTVQSTASSALQTGKEYLASAQTMVQPTVEKARSMVTGTASTGSTSTQPDAVPATTAPLEFDSHVANTPYPATTTGQPTKIGEL